MSFKQAELWEAVQRPREISSEAVEQMEEVVNRYPYFQLIHTLIAKAKHDQQTPDAYAALGRAAIYAPDRRLLRQVFYDELTVVLPDSDTEARPQDLAAAPVAESDEPLATNLAEASATEEMADPSEEEAVTPVAEESAPPQTPNEEDSDSLREELAKTLEGLRASKEQAAESQSVDKPDAEVPGTDVPGTDVPGTDVPGTDVPGTDVPGTDVPGTDVPGTDVPGTDVPRTRQQEIIDRFVTANPQITRDASTTDENASDLSAPSSAFQDDLVTENLAEIMLKQGKTDKATNLYEKLMVKYPEKKAYFAQKIEQLKK